jgi:hypothetical protein
LKPPTCTSRRFKMFAWPRRCVRRIPPVAGRTGARRSAATHWRQSTIPVSGRGPCDDPWPCRECSTADRSCRSPCNRGLLDLVIS